MAQAQRNTFGAILLIGLGILFLIAQVLNVNLWTLLGFSWPTFVLIPGVIFLALAATGTRKMAAFAFPGTIISGTGAILWYQNLTHNWESWAYVWTLYPAFIGLAMMFVGWRTQDEKSYGTGRAMVNFSLIAFLMGAAFFELFIFHSGGLLTGWLFPVGLIALGGFLLLSGRGAQAQPGGLRSAQARRRPPAPDRRSAGRARSAAEGIGTPLGTNFSRRGGSQTRPSHRVIASKRGCALLPLAV